MSKIIVTHKNPDLDAIGSVWLLKRFDKKNFEKAEVKFVRAGDTFRNAPAESDPDIVHVDTGMGRFDHHQTDERTCAAELIYKDLINKRPELDEDIALGRVIDFLVDIDHFGAFSYPDATHDRYIFMLEQILNGFKLGGHGDDEDLIRLGMECLDGVYSMMKILVEAEEELEKGGEFESKWGKSLGVLTSNDAVIKLGLKKGYVVVVRKDPDEGNVRIKAAPGGKVDLSEAYKEVGKKDNEGTWFLHSSRKMLLNGSSKNPGQKPSKLKLEEVMEMLK